MHAFSGPLSQVRQIHASNFGRVLGLIDPEECSFNLFPVIEGNIMVFEIPPPSEGIIS
jgi:hypothetical protein